MTAVDEEADIVVTSTNVDYVPRPTYGRITLHLLVDGTYGVYDPVNWPQVFAPELAYIAAVRKAVPFHHPLSVLWRPPTPSHFVPLEGVPARNFGSLTEDFLAPFVMLAKKLSRSVREFTSRDPSASHNSLLHHEMVVRHTSQRLREFPATLRDHGVQVSLFRRHWLLGTAYMEFADLTPAPPEESSISVRTDLMGAWTSEPELAQLLHERGIPVWRVDKRHLVPLSKQNRSTRLVPFCVPSSQMDKNRISDTCLYDGQVGLESLRATLRSVHMYHDIARNPCGRRRELDGSLSLAAASWQGLPARGSKDPPATFRSASKPPFLTACM